MQDVIDKIRKSQNKKSLDLICTVALSLTIVVIIWITLLSRQQEIREVHLIPLWSYARIFSGKWSSLFENICNILMFLPVGFLLAVVFSTNRRETLAIGFLISMAIELSQLIFALGSFEVDDLINNTFGAFLGYQVFVRKNIRPSNADVKKSFRQIVSVVVIMTALIGTTQWASNYSLHQNMIKFAAMNDRDGTPNLLILNGKNGRTWDSNVHVRYLGDGGISISGHSDIRSWYELGTQNLEEGHYILTGLSGVEPKTVAIEIAFYDDIEGKFVQTVKDLGADGDVEFDLSEETLVRIYVSVYPGCNCDVVARPAIYKEGV